MVDLTMVAASLEKVLESGASTIDSVHSVISENRDGLGLIIDRLAALEAAASGRPTNLNSAVEENREPLNATMVNFEQLSAGGLPPGAGADRVPGRDAAVSPGGQRQRQRSCRESTSDPGTFFPTSRICPEPRKFLENAGRPAAAPVRGPNRGAALVEGSDADQLGPHLPDASGPRGLWDWPPISSHHTLYMSPSVRWRPHRSGGREVRHHRISRCASPSLHPHVADSDRVLRHRPVGVRGR